MLFSSLKLLRHSAKIQQQQPQKSLYMMQDTLQYKTHLTSHSSIIQNVRGFFSSYLCIMLFLFVCLLLLLCPFAKHVQSKMDKNKKYNKKKAIFKVTKKKPRKNV